MHHSRCLMNHGRCLMRCCIGCLGDQDPTFTGALERFLGDGFADVWWLVESLSTERRQDEPTRQAATSGLLADMMHLLSSFSSSPSASQKCEASEASAVDATAVVQQVQQVCHLPS